MCGGGRSVYGILSMALSIPAFLLGTPDPSVPELFLRSCLQKVTLKDEVMSAYKQRPRLLLFHYKGGGFPKLGVSQLDTNPLASVWTPLLHLSPPTKTWEIRQTHMTRLTATAFAVMNSDVSNLSASMKQ